MSVDGNELEISKVSFHSLCESEITISFIFGLLILDRNYAMRKIPACERRHSYANFVTE